MRAFGLELRKVKHLRTQELYKDVDKVLDRYKIPANGVSQQVQEHAIGHALHKMLSVKSSFDVCCIRDCSDIAQIVISSERLKVYSSIHCMNWSDMTEEFRVMIVSMVLDDFRSILSPQEEEEIQSIIIQ